MKLSFKKHGTVLVSVIAAITILVTALLTKDSEYENAWLYVFVIWSFVFAGLEVYSNKKGRDQEK